MARRRRREPEVAHIRGVTHDGKGIADLPGKTVFVAGALTGEEVEFIRRKSRRNFDEAELLEVRQASPERIEPKCDAFGRCGGCALQHISDDEQRTGKSQVLADNLQRIGRVEPKTWLEPLTADAWHYRRRARLAVKDVPGKGRVLVGFRERSAPYITDMHRCEVLAEPIASLIDPLSDFVGTLSIRSRLPQIEVAVGDNESALVFRVLDPASDADLEQFRKFGEQYGLQIWLQPGGLDSLYCVYPEKPAKLHYRLDAFDVTVEFSPVGFVQINADINRQMVERAVDLLETESGDRVLDLYCGIGNFSLPLARRSRTVLGIEGDAQLVAAANDNASLNDCANAEFRVTDLSKISGDEPWIQQGADRVLLDPARSGAAEVVAHMPKIGAKRVVYVSCHPGTLARDAGIMVNEHGYSLEAAGIIDMFPHTAHVESIAVFNK
ncbi:MAG: 23S rRNA (uracil(1939)-C(5))-methyltransferase RlmD [Pseudomonadota bacterium]